MMEDILRKLVAFRSVSGDAEAVKPLFDYVDDFVTQRGMYVERYTWNGFESLIATVKPGLKTPKVMLAAHADVVPADDSMFTMRTEDGRYIGRGVLDMKFAIAAYLQIIDDIKYKLADYDIGVMITSDEELGGRDGAARLVDEGYIPEVCVLPDGGDDWQVQTASKGILLYEVSVTGTSAHGSRPWLGDNALIKLIGLLDEIAALFPRHPRPDTNTISLNVIKSGKSFSQIPNFAKMNIDVRTINATEYTRIHEAVLRVCEHNQAICTVVSDGVPTSYELDDPLIAPYAKIVTEVTGIPMRGFLAMGASDARYFVPYGTPCILTYPLGGNLHADDEWIDANAFQQFRIILSRYIDEVAKTAESLSLS